jgi:nucleoside-diphosphate-sugar epimerase
VNTIQKYVPELVIVQNEFKKDFDQRNYMVSNQKIESMGWKPLYSLEDGVVELIKGYQLIKKYNNKNFTNL